MARFSFLLVLLATHIFAWPWNHPKAARTPRRSLPTAPQNLNTIPLIRRPTKPKRRRFTKRSNNAYLMLEDGNEEYVAVMAIGTPETGIQTFDLPVDTASSDTWIAGHDFTCMDAPPNCQPGPLFTPSSSFTPLNASLSDMYGTGQILGEFGTDTIALGGTTSSLTPYTAVS
jgi:Eukaryotic aspartyl protease